jgi:hypothetical protein
MKQMIKGSFGAGTRTNAFGVEEVDVFNKNEMAYVIKIRAASNTRLERISGLLTNFYGRLTRKTEKGGAVRDDF